MGIHKGQKLDLSTPRYDYRRSKFRDFFDSLPADGTPIRFPEEMPKRSGYQRLYTAARKMGYLPLRIHMEPVLRDGYCEYFVAKGGEEEGG